MAGTTKQSQQIFWYFCFRCNICFNWNQLTKIWHHQSSYGQYYLSRAHNHQFCLFRLLSELWALIIFNDVILHGKFNFIFIIAKKVNKNTNDDEKSIRILNARLVRRRTKWIRWIEYFQIIKYWIWHWQSS